MGREDVAADRYTFMVFGVTREQVESGATVDACIANFGGAEALAAAALADWDI